MSRIIDLTGMVFGALTATKRVGSDRFGDTIWECKCACGEPSLVRGSSLRSGGTRSCGCHHGQPPVNWIHGGTSGVTRTGRVQSEYSTWRLMKGRCFNHNNNKYYLYGGRGITVCDRWKNSFASFLADMGPKPTEKHTLDRIDPNKDYAPDNCRWATQQDQQRNRRNNVFVEISGERFTIFDVAELLKIKESSARARLKRNPERLRERVAEQLRLKESDSQR
jgi:hypothetical protein